MDTNLIKLSENLQEPTTLSTILEGVLSSIPYLIPEFVVVILGLFIFVADFFIVNKKRLLLFGAFALMLIFYLVVQQWLRLLGQQDFKLLFSDMLLDDRLAAFSKFILVLVTAFSFVLAYLEKTKDSLIHSAEYVFLTLVVLLGAMLLVMANNLLMIYLSIETISIGSYILVSLNRDKKSAESGMRYMLFGGASSGVMLYGMTWLYGFTGTMDITSFEFFRGLLSIPALPLMLASFMTLGGFLFKIAAVPFHFWTPSVYEGSPTSVLAFLSVIPKLAGFIVLVRFLSAYDNVSLIFVDVDFDWQMVIALLAGISMIVGNLAAAWQNNAKRMLGYSSIAHTGFLLIGIVAYSDQGIEAILFYWCIYGLMNLASFLFVILLSNQLGSVEISDWKGQGAHHPVWSVFILIVLLALTGLPPTAGFSAKLWVLASTWNSYQFTHDIFILILIIVAVINTVVALFYYLKIPYWLFFKKTDSQDTIKAHDNIFGTMVLGVLTIPLLVLFIYPQWLLELIELVKFTF